MSFTYFATFVKYVNESVTVHFFSGNPSVQFNYIEPSVKLKTFGKMTLFHFRTVSSEFIQFFFTLGSRKNRASSFKIQI